MSGTAGDCDSDETIADIENPSVSSPSMLDLDNEEQGRQQLQGSDSLLITIQQEQLLIEQEIYSNNSSHNEPFNQKRLSAIEEGLKKISIENQNEHKSIAALFSQTNSNSSQSASTHPLREKLILLAEKQKALLSCMAKHKELLKQLPVSSSCDSVPTNSTSSSQQGSHEISGAKLPENEISEPSSDHNITDETEVDQVSNPQSESTSVNNPTIPESSIDHQAVMAKSNDVNLEHPVPLQLLVKHNILLINEILSTSLLGCQFKASVLSNGQLVDASNSRKVYSSPQRWLTSCWSILGHHNKRINSRQAYKMITTTKGVSLLSLCEQYNREQISSYQKKQELLKSVNTVDSCNSQPMECERSISTNQQPMEYIQQSTQTTVINKQSTGSTVISQQSTGSTVKNKQSTGSIAKTNYGPINRRTPFTAHSVFFDLDHILTYGHILCHPPPHYTTSLSLPDNFWDSSSLEISDSLQQNIDKDLNWFD